MYHVETGSTGAPLHPFAKMAMTYMGLMAAVAVLSLVFYSVNVLDGIKGPLTQLAGASYAAMIIVPALAIAGLAKGLRIGAYLAFAALALSVLILLAFTWNPDIRWNVLIPVLVPHAAVGALLARSLPALRTLFDPAAAKH